MSGKRTDHVHGSGSTLQRNTQNRQDRPPPVNGVGEQIFNTRVGLELPLAVERFLNVAQLLLGAALAVGPVPEE